MIKTPVDGYINEVSEEEVIEALQLMETSPSYITKSAYRANADKWPNHRISFIDQHIAYLKAHPALNPYQYIANLRLMLKRRR